MSSIIILIFNILIYGFPPLVLGFFARKLESRIFFYSYFGFLFVFTQLFAVFYAIKLSSEIVITGGNIAYSSLIMLTLTFSILHNDPKVIRNIIIIEVLLNLFLFFLYSFLHLVLSLDNGILNIYNLVPDIFSTTIFVNIVSIILFVFEILTMFCILEKIKQSVSRISILFLSFIIMFLGILSLDGILFPLIINISEPNLGSNISGGLIGKLILGILYSPFLFLFLLVFNKSVKAYHDKSFPVRRIIFPSRTELKQKLRYSEEKYRRILENIQEGYFELDLEGKFTFINESFADIIKYPEREILNKSYKEFVPLDVEKTLSQIFKQISEQKEGINALDFVIIKNTGKRLFVESSLNPKFDFEKNVIGFSGLIKDITKRKLAERRLKQSEQKFKALINESPYAIVLMNSSNKILECNPATKKIIGYDEEELLGESFLNSNIFFREKDYGKLEEVFESLLQKTDQLPIELKIRKKEGVEIWVRIKLTTIERKNEKFIQAIFHDITKRKEAELLQKEFNKELEEKVEIRTEKLNKALKQQKNYVDEIIKASQFKDEFMASMSHELRTPLNAIMGFTDLMLEESYGQLSKTQREFLNDIKDSAEHQLDMINNILDISRIESGQLKLNCQNFSLKSIIDQVQSTFRPTYKKKGLDFEVEGLDEEASMYCNPIRIKQILYNLISNAIKFTKEGKVSLIIQETEDKWIFKIKDTGIGISKDNFDLIFKEFRRVESEYVRSVSGSGLGLSVTKRLIELHNGEITFTSSLGKGSTFQFYIPK